MRWRSIALPEKYRRRLRSTNMQERLNEEIRRRERVIRTFPNDESALSLIGALLAEQNEVWQNGVTWTWTNSRSGLPRRLKTIRHRLG